MAERVLTSSSITILALLFSVRVAAAQTEPCLHQSVSVSISTSQGQIVTSLPPDDFKASLRHKPVKVLSATLDDSPRRVMLVLDASGSMIADNREWNSLLDAGIDLLNSMREHDQAALLVLSSHVEETLALTTDHTSVIRAITARRTRAHFDSKEPRRAALWDALAQGIALFGDLRNGDTLFIISDGNDRSSESRPAALEAYAPRLRFFALIPGARYDWAKTPEIPSTPDFVPPSQALERLVLRSGGVAVIRPSDYPILHGSDPVAQPQRTDAATEQWKSMKAFSQKLRTQIDQVFTYQRLEIELPEAITSTTEWNLSLSGSGRKGLSVAYPHELEPCTTPHSASGAVARIP